jgi:hypothetical protein
MKTSDPMTNPGVNATRSAAHVIATTGRDGNERALPLSLAATCQRPRHRLLTNPRFAVGATRHDTTAQGEARHGASRPAWSYHQLHSRKGTPGRKPSPPPGRRTDGEVRNGCGTHHPLESRSVISPAA